MVVVAIVGVAFGTLRLAATSLTRRGLAAIYGARERAFRSSAETLAPSVAKADELAARDTGYRITATDDRRAMKRCRAMADYNAALRRKYERGARYPWLSVPPDPLPPK
jgi:hypothetical protein